MSEGERLVDDVIQKAKLEGHAEVMTVLMQEAELLMDEAFRCRALGQESVGKQKSDTAQWLHSLISSLPTKLRAL